MITAGTSKKSLQIVPPVPFRSRGPILLVLIFAISFTACTAAESSATAAVSQYHDPALKIAFCHPGSWVLKASGNALKMKPSADAAYPFIGIVADKMEQAVTAAELRGFYRDMDSLFDGQYGTQFDGFVKERSGHTWMNGNLALYYQFSFNDANGAGCIGKQVSSVRGDCSFTVMMTVKASDFSKWDQVLNMVRESFAGYGVLGLTPSAASDYLVGLDSYFSSSFEPAEKAFSKVIASAPGFAEPCYFKALSIQGKYGYSRIGESSELFGLACQKNPDHFPAANQLAMCWAAVANTTTPDGAQNLDRAFKVLDDSLKINGQCEETLLYRASLLINVGKFDLALASLNSLVAINPRHDEARELKMQLEKKIAEATGDKKPAPKGLNAKKIKAEIRERPKGSDQAPTNPFISAEAAKWHSDTRDRYRIKVPSSWKSDLTLDGTDHVRAFLSPDENVAVKIRSFDAAPGVSIDIISALFEQRILGGGTLLFKQSKVVNGVPASIAAYRGAFNGIEVGIGALFLIGRGKGYILWSMIPSALFQQRSAEADAILNTFEVTD